MKTSFEMPEDCELVEESKHYLNVHYHGSNAGLMLAVEALADAGLICTSAFPRSVQKPDSAWFGLKKFKTVYVMDLIFAKLAAFQ